MKINAKIKKIARVSTLIGLSSLIGIIITPRSGFASPFHEIMTAANTDSDTLRQGIPSRRLGGGTRDNSHVFAQTYTYLAALVMPEGISITTAERPTLLFYVPEMHTAQTGEFVLRDSHDNLVYESTIEIEQNGGTLDIDLTEIAGMPALTINETYQWYFSIVPDATDRSHDVVVQGGVRRVDVHDWLAQSINQSTEDVTLALLGNETPLQKARAYQRANLWHDAAVTINELRQANPTDGEVISEWNNLIEMTGLSSVVEPTGTEL